MNCRKSTIIDKTYRPCIGNVSGESSADERGLSPEATWRYLEATEGQMPTEADVMVSRCVGVGGLVRQQAPRFWRGRREAG